VTETQVTEAFRLAYVPGVTPGKWARTWEERLPLVPLELLAVEAARGEPALLDGAADAGLLRLPVDRGRLSAIPLYTETTVVVFPKEHWLAAAEEVAVDDLAEEVALHPLDDVLDWPAPPGVPAKQRPDTTADAIALVAAGIGVLMVPQSLARLHHRRDLTFRPLAGQGEDDPADASLARSQVALAWPEDRTTELVEEFIGIVRGRTVNSSRGRGAGTATPPAGAGKAAKAGKSGKPGKPGKPQPSGKAGSAAGRRRQGGAARPQRRGKR
jgi:DNA-binding transcriptional LysR family regulator